MPRICTRNQLSNKFEYNDRDELNIFVKDTQHRRHNFYYDIGHKQYLFFKNYQRMYFKTILFVRYKLCFSTLYFRLFTLKTI